MKRLFLLIIFILLIFSIDVYGIQKIILINSDPICDEIKYLEYMDKTIFNYWRYNVRADKFGDIFSVAFTGSANCWYCQSNIWFAKSYDYGDNWLIKHIGENNHPLAIKMLDMDKIVIVGTHGIFRSTDGGNTFTTKDIWDTIFIYATGGAVYIIDYDNIIIFYNSGIITHYINFKRTTDGGNTWYTQSFPNYGNVCYASIGKSDNYFYVLYYDGDHNKLKLFRSSDGFNWTEHNSDVAPVKGNGWSNYPNPKFMKVINDNIIYFVAPSSIDGYFYLYKTTNGGLTWSQKLINTVTVWKSGADEVSYNMDIYGNTIYASYFVYPSGDLYLSISNDDGNTWEHRILLTEYSIGWHNFPIVDQNGWYIFYQQWIDYDVKGKVALLYEAYRSKCY
ncbi:MAG: sialidase family protein [Thermoplasmata archaeon]